MVTDNYNGAHVDTIADLVYNDSTLHNKLRVHEAIDKRLLDRKQRALLDLTKIYQQRKNDPQEVLINDIFQYRGIEPQRTPIDDTEIELLYRADMLDRVIDAEPDEIRRAEYVEQKRKLEKSDEIVKTETDRIKKLHRDMLHLGAAPEMLCQQADGSTHISDEYRHWETRAKELRREVDYYANHFLQAEMSYLDPVIRESYDDLKTQALINRLPGDAEK